MFHIWENTHQTAQANNTAVFYYDVARDMAVRVAAGEVSHGFLYENNNGMREYIFDSHTWRPQVPYDAEPVSSHGQSNDDEECAYTSEEDDYDEEQHQREYNPAEDADPWGHALYCKESANSKAKAQSKKPNSNAKGQGNVLPRNVKGKG